MALRGTGTGGCSFALPPDYDDTADLSVFLWVRGGGSAVASTRILTLVNAARTKGFVVQRGGGVGGSALASDVVVSGSSGLETNWGSSVSQNGRGRSILPGLSETDFCPLAFSLRGSGAPDNTGNAGAMQLHEVWWKGALAGIASTSIGAGVPSQGNRAVLLCRDPSNLSSFDGWVADVAVWQGHRLTHEEAIQLSSGASPLWIAPEKLLFCRSFRTGLAAETEDTTLTMIGDGASVEPDINPPRLIAAARAAHRLTSGEPLIAGGPGGGSEPGEPGGENGVGGISPASATLAHRARMVRLSGAQKTTCRPPAMTVPPEHRVLNAGC